MTAVLIGMLAGILLTGIAVIIMMRSKMMVTYTSSKNFEDTCQAVEDTVAGFKSEGWGFPIPKWHFYKTFTDKGLAPAGIRNIMVYFVCNAKLAEGVISSDYRMTGMMPCSWAVMEKEDGTVEIAKMNVGLMALMFPGAIRTPMKHVEETDSRMLQTIL